MKKDHNINIERACKIGELCEKSTFTRDIFFAVPPRPERNHYYTPKILVDIFCGKKTKKGGVSRFKITNLKASRSKSDAGV